MVTCQSENCKHRNLEKINYKLQMRNNFNLHFHSADSAELQIEFRLNLILNFEQHRINVPENLINRFILKTPLPYSRKIDKMELKFYKSKARED